MFSRKKCETNLKKYGVSHLEQTYIPTECLKILQNKEQFEKIISGKTYREISDIPQVDGATIGKRAEKHQLLHVISNGFDQTYWEKRISEFLTDNHIHFQKNDRSILNPLELDFYIPKYNVAFEINGLYWHSEISGKKKKMYHYNKWKQCNSRGIQLFQFFEDELETKMPIIKNKILYVTNRHKGKSVGARNIAMDYPTDSKEEFEFLHRNHLQGFAFDRNVAVGGWYNNTLIGVMNISEINEQLIEITRYATDIYNLYPGLFSKMLDWYVKKSKFIGKIVTYSNNNHSSGNLYKNLGFCFENNTLPDYYVTDYKSRWSRMSWFNSNIKPNSKSKWEFTQECSFDRIWDSGKIKWCKVIS